MTYASRVPCCFQEGRTPLHAAADGTSVGADTVVELLAAAGADINATDKVSWDACVNKHWYVVPGMFHHFTHAHGGAGRYLGLRPLSGVPTSALEICAVRPT